MLNFPKHFARRVARFEQECAQFRHSGRGREGVVFLGDSLVEFYKGPVPWVNRGICSDHLRWPDLNVFERIDRNRLHPDPEAIVTLLGINDLNDAPDAVDRHTEAYRTLLGRLAELYPDARLAVCSLLPTRGAAGHLNPRIEEFNHHLADLASSSGARFLNLHERFVDPATRQARGAFLVEDGIHVSRDGYAELTALVREDGVELGLGDAAMASKARPAQPSAAGPAAGALLLGANYYGTLAAARCFGRRGVAVTTADESRHARAGYSRHVTSRHVSPPVAEPQALLDWLVRWGHAHPGTVLYPSNDHLAWLFAAHRETLGRAFVMYSPPEDAVMTLLDKARLHDACAHPDVGIDVPETHVLGPAGASAPIAAHLRYPVILKPRTQVFLEGGIKGVPVKDAAELGAALDRFRALVRFNRVLTDRYPDIAEPMVQEYLSAAETRIFSISGFVGQDGEIVARAAMKVLQRPRKMGIGLCFEGRPVEQPLLDKLAALCRHVGYFGVFEAEFIVDGDRRLLIDFNPRYYSQMAFEIARGLALPMLVWHAARGDRSAFAQEVARARRWVPSGEEVYLHQGMLNLILTLQGWSGQMSREDVHRWRHWRRTHRAAATDAVRDPDDRMPALVDVALWVRDFARHPRSFIRSFVLNKDDRARA